MVVIFTYRSPFNSVPEFVEDEIPYWCKSTRILVVSLARDHKEQRVIAENATAYAICPNNTLFARLDYFLSGLRRPGVAREVVRCLLRSPRRLIQRLRILASEVQAAERYYRGTNKVLRAQRSTLAHRVILYSYWCGPATRAALEIARHRFTKHATVVSRVHGADLYEYANPANYLPSRDMLKLCDRAYAISEHGKRYLREHWGCDSLKIELGRLGIPDFFIGLYPKQGEWFHIVSCSYVTPIKRVHCIAEAISRISRVNLFWTHIGGGPGLSDLGVLCKRLLGGRSNVNYELKGNVSHDRVLEFLRSGQSNLFVNVSMSEGIPVSMMEAHCCGIPVLGPSVGGVKEIILEGVNGHLLPQDFTIEYLAEIIEKISKMDAACYGQLCFNARRTWMDKFSAKNNYTVFIQSLQRLGEK